MALPLFKLFGWNSTSFFESVNVKVWIGSLQLYHEPVCQVAPCAHGHGCVLDSLCYHLEVLFGEAHLVPFLIKAGVIYADFLDRV